MCGHKVAASYIMMILVLPNTAPTFSLAMLTEADVMAKEMTWAKENTSRYKKLRGGNEPMRVPISIKGNHYLMPGLDYKSLFKMVANDDFYDDAVAAELETKMQTGGSVLATVNKSDEADNAKALIFETNRPAMDDTELAALEENDRYEAVFPTKKIEEETYKPYDPPNDSFLKQANFTSVEKKQQKGQTITEQNLRGSSALKRT